ncbi:hypothetical protein [Streptomyces sp. NPDC053560]|uniref:hypothetical protein n=1 Tax=Streptomyces sp. NPDC053560 TaxID=3365711 RepID=UPI0037D43C8C
MTRPGPADKPQDATPAPARDGRCAPKNAARQGVLSALRPGLDDLLPAEPERVFFGLHIVAPPEWSGLCRAAATCRCGYERQAKGRAAVQRLVEDWTDHPQRCRLQTVERRKAA